MRDSGREQKSGRGRHRGEYKDDNALLSEAKAKGSYRAINHEPGLAHEAQKTEDEERIRHQRGYGANQQHEAPKKTPHQNRAQGAEHG